MQSSPTESRERVKGGTPLRFPNKHADIVCSCHQLNRAKESPEGRRPFGGVKGQRPLGSPNKHAGTVCRCTQLNRANGSPEGRRPFGGVQRQRLWYRLGSKKAQMNPAIC